MSTIYVVVAQGSVGTGSLLAQAGLTIEGAWVDIEDANIVRSQGYMEIHDIQLDETQSESWFVLYHTDENSQCWRGPFPDREAAEHEFDVASLGRQPIYVRTPS